MKNSIKITLMVIAFYNANIFCQSNYSSELFNIFEYRNFSPHRVGSWISDIAVPETNNPEYKYTFYVSGRHGGVFKTINNGTTFQQIFDDYGTSSIGAIEIPNSNPNTIWVGTGEASNARSTHSGNGIYKSIDGGETFKFMGLADSHHIPKIIIHPKNENIIYVAVMGHLFSKNKMRGVFKTIDGGKSWQKILYINQQTGVIDIAINRDNPNILYAATYDKIRYPWHLEAGGTNSGIYKTIDGGNSWDRLSGGFPNGNIGRIGLDIYRKNPNILYAVVENLNPKENDPEDLKYGEVYFTNNAGKSWVKTNHDTVDVSGKAAYSFNQIMIDQNNYQNIYINSISMISSNDGGKSWNDVKWPPKHLFTGMFGDIRTMWINPSDSRHLIIGSDGGIYVTYDGGKNMSHLYHIPLGEAYDIEVDDSSPYNIYVGLQDHEGWKAPSNSYNGMIGTPHWNIVGMWDGMYHKVDHKNNRWLYFTTQFGSHHRVDQLNGTRQKIEPKPNNGLKYRYTWNTPIEISPHNSKIIYTGGQYLLRSKDRGNSWEAISDDLTSNDSIKIAGKGHIMYCTITSISESPIKQGLIWVGTDDGKVHLTKNAGRSWFESTNALVNAGAPENYWISRVTTSSHNPAVAFVSITGFYHDDFKPYVYMSTDYGRSWKSISSNLPQEPVNIVLQDEDNKNLLWLATDGGVYLSINSGIKWINFNQNIPSVPIKDIEIQEREDDLVLGTYGRGVYITDIAPIKQISNKILNSEIHLFDIEPQPKKNYSDQKNWGNFRLMGDSHIYTPNEPNGLMIYYYLKNDSKSTSKIVVSDNKNSNITEISGSSSKGINRVVWNTKDVKPGQYYITLMIGKNKITKRGIVEPAYKWPVGNNYN